MYEASPDGDYPLPALALKFHDRRILL